MSWRDLYDIVLVLFHMGTKARGKFYPQTIFDEWWQKNRGRNSSMAVKTLCELFFRQGWQAMYRWWYTRINLWRFVSFEEEKTKVTLSPGKINIEVKREYDLLGRNLDDIQGQVKAFCNWTIKHYLERNSFSAPSKNMLQLARLAYTEGATQQNQEQWGQRVQGLTKQVKEFAFEQAKKVS